MPSYFSPEEYNQLLSGSGPATQASPTQAPIGSQLGRTVSREEYDKLKASRATAKPSTDVAATPKPNEVGWLAPLTESLKGLARGTVDVAKNVTGAIPEMAGGYQAAQADVLRQSPAAMGPGAMPPPNFDYKAAQTAVQQAPTPNPMAGQAAAAEQFFAPYANAPSIQANPTVASTEYLGNAPLWTKATKLASDVGQGAPSVAAAIGGAMVGGPAGAGVMGGALTASPWFEKARKEGLGEKEALAGAAVIGGGSAILNSVPFLEKLPDMVPAAVKGRIATFVAKGLAEAGTETAEGGLNPFAEVASGQRKLNTLKDFEALLVDAGKGIKAESGTIPASFLLGGMIPSGANREQAPTPNVPAKVELAAEASKIYEDLKKSTDTRGPQPIEPDSTDALYEEIAKSFETPEVDASGLEGLPDAIKQEILNLSPQSTVTYRGKTYVGRNTSIVDEQARKTAEAQATPTQGDYVDVTATPVAPREQPTMAPEPITPSEPIPVAPERGKGPVERPAEVGVPISPSRASVRAQDRPYPGERPTTTTGAPQFRGAIRRRGGEAVAAEEPSVAPAAEFVGLQERPRGQEPIALYNIPTPEGGKTTVTAETAKAQGYSVPEPPEAAPEISKEPPLRLGNSFKNSAQAAAASDALDEVMALGEPNPMNPREVVIDGVRVEPTTGNGRLVIKSMVSMEQGSGAGSRALARVLDIADANDVEVALSPTQIGNTPESRLRDFYSRFGFEESRQGQMIRKPSQDIAGPTETTATTVPKAAAFLDMVAEAQRWRGAAKNFDSSLTNDRDRLRLNNATTKGDLDAYLMKKFGIDASEARDVSNQLTRDNLPDDMTADPADFAQEPWAQIGKTAQTPESQKAVLQQKLAERKAEMDARNAVTYSPETQRIVDAYGGKDKALEVLKRQRDAIRGNEKVSPETLAAIEELTGGKTVGQADMFGLGDFQKAPKTDTPGQTRLPQRTELKVKAEMTGQSIDIGGTDGLHSFRDLLTRLKVRPEGNFTKEDIGLDKEKSSFWVSNTGKISSDQALAMAKSEDYGLLPEDATYEDLAKLMKGKLDPGIQVEPEGVYIPAIDIENKRFKPTSTTQSIGDIMKSIGMTEEVPAKPIRKPRPAKEIVETESKADATATERMKEVAEQLKSGAITVKQADKARKQILRDKLIENKYEKKKEKEEKAKAKTAKAKAPSKWLGGLDVAAETPKPESITQDPWESERAKEEKAIAISEDAQDRAADIEKAKQKIKDIRSGKAGYSSVPQAGRTPSKAGAIRSLEQDIERLSSEPTEYDIKRIIEQKIERLMAMDNAVPSALLDNLKTPKYDQGTPLRQQFVEMLEARGYSLAGDSYAKKSAPQTKTQSQRAKDDIDQHIPMLEQQIDRAQREGSSIARRVGIADTIMVGIHPDAQDALAKRLWEIDPEAAEQAQKNEFLPGKGPFSMSKPEGISAKVEADPYAKKQSTTAKVPKKTTVKRILESVPSSIVSYDPATNTISFDPSDDGITKVRDAVDKALDSLDVKPALQAKYEEAHGDIMDAVFSKQEEAPRPTKGKKRSGETGAVNIGLAKDAAKKVLDIVKKAASSKSIEFSHGLGKDTKNANVVRVGTIARLVSEGEQAVIDFNEGYRTFINEGKGRLKSAANRFREAPEDMREMLNRFLIEQDPEVKQERLEALPEPMRESAERMRTTVDALSRQLRNEGVASKATAEKIENQEGYYLRRTFKIFKDPDWKSQISEKMKDAVRQHIAKEEELDPSSTEVTRILNGYMNIADNTEPSIVRRGKKLGTKDLSTLQKRGEFDQSILDLWGVEKDGIVNFLETLTAQANLIANHRFLRAVARIGEGKTVFSADLIKAHTAVDTDPSHPDFNAEYDRLIRENKLVPFEEGAPKKDRFNPSEIGRYGAMAGSMVERDFKEAMQEAVAHHEITGMLGELAFLNSVTKAGMTALSPKTASLNFWSNSFIAAQAHHLFYGSPKAIANRMNLAMKVAKIETSTRHDKSIRALGNKLIGLGVLKDTIGTTELQKQRAETKKTRLASLMKKAPEMADSAIEKVYGADPHIFQSISKALGMGVEQAFALYQAGDDVWKTFGWLAERDMLKEAYPNWSERQLDVESALRVRRFYTTYSELPSAVKALRHNPLIAPFVAFYAEVPRGMANTMLQAKQDIIEGQRTGNTVLRNQGLKRAGSMMVAAATLEGISQYYKLKNDVDDEDEETLRMAQPSWDKAGTFGWYEVDRTNGKAKAYNLSAMVPQAIAFDPLTAFFRAETIGQGVHDFAKELSSPLYQPEIGFMALRNQWYGIDSDNKPIFTESDPMGEQWYKRGAQFWKDMSPGAYKSVVNVSKAEDKVGKAFDELSGQRTVEIDLPKSLFYKAIALQKAGQEQNRDIGKAVKAEDRDAIMEQYNQRVEAHKLAWSEASDMIKGMKRFGVDNMLIVKTLKEAGFDTPRDRNRLINGNYVEPKMPDWIKKATR